MCGIAGFWFRQPPGEGAARRIGNAMAERIAHRGPDGSGLWTSNDGTVTLAHRRLAIVDLSAAGHQPMRSHSGRFELVFNGEIYNHSLLRKQLPPMPWRGHSDTETLLAGFERWGIEETLRKSVGMFAIALWDRERRQLTLARDRMGEKPLYFGRAGGDLLFASELKALHAVPGFDPSIDPDAVSLLLRCGYIPAPYSIYREVRKLPPGSWVQLDAPGREAVPQAYWSLREAVQHGQRNPLECSDTEAVDDVERCLGEAISLQRVADVPLGAFLSGGVDSSAVVALMQKQSAAKVRTFSIGFDDPSLNEAEHAKAVASHLGTEHTELYVSGRQALDLVPRLPELYCEPFADSSQVPTVLVSQIARRHVTVALSGDAGDELYGGYTRYDTVAQAWSDMARVPRPLRLAVALAAGAFGAAFGTAAAGQVAAQAAGGRRDGAALLGERALRLREQMRLDTLEDFYRFHVSMIPFPERYALQPRDPAWALNSRSDWPQQLAPDERLMFLDQISYLPDDILVKVDRAAMSASLETRVPMLDHRVVEQAWRLPLRFKRRGGINKWVLRQVLYRHVPAALIERPKQGFAVPLGDWLRGPLRAWAEELLDPARMQRQGLLDAASVQRLWRDHIGGRWDRKYPLWNVLMLQAWLAKHADAPASTAVVGVDADVVV
jgi:asparagine synthase (glutamine-hydrolysing)